MVRTLNNGTQHYCGVFHPDADKQNVLMSGCQVRMGHFLTSHYSVRKAACCNPQPWLRQP